MNIDKIIKECCAVTVTPGRETLDRHSVTVDQLKKAIQVAYYTGFVEGRHSHDDAAVMDAGDQ